MTTGFKSIIKATTSLTTRFNRDECGALALMLALAAVPFFVVAGVALDTFRAGSADAQVQGSLDAAALAAAAAEPSTSERTRRKLAEDTFAANINSKTGKQLTGSPDISFTIEAVTVAYNTKLPTTVMKIGGIESLNASGSYTATLRLPQKAEIVLSLDYSGSMNDLSNGAKKYITMKNAAIDMVKGVTEDGTNKDVLFGLVPFSHHVYTTLPSSMVVAAQAPPGLAARRTGPIRSTQLCRPLCRATTIPNGASPRRRCTLLMAAVHI